MKRIVVVLAVALILTMTVWDAAFSRGTPFSYKGPDVDPGGEDHPWGGEQEADPRGLPIYQLGYSGGTGYFLIDFIFDRYTEYLKLSREGTLKIEGRVGTIDDNTKDIPKENTKGN